VKRQPWAKGFEDRIDQVNAAAAKPGALVDTSA